MASAAGRKQFPTKFVWDHGGSEVGLAINGGPPIHLQREEDGTFEVTTSLGQGRYEYCFSVDGTWTHDPDLPTIKNSQGCYNNLLKIVDAKDIVANKAANVEKVEEATKLGVANFVEKCFSDATLHETVQREKLFSAGSFSNFSSNFSENGDQCSEGSDDFDDFPDLDEALDMENPIFITESPLPNRSMKMAEKVSETHNPPRRQDTWQNALDCIVMHSQSTSSVFSNSNLQLSPTPPVSIPTSPVSNPTPTPTSPFGHLTPTPALDVTTPTPQDVIIPEGVSPSCRSKASSEGIQEMPVPSPSEASCLAPTIPPVEDSTTNSQYAPMPFQELNSSLPTLHSADDRLTANEKRFAEKECKEELKGGGEGTAEPLLRMVEVELSMGKLKSDSMSVPKDSLIKSKIDPGKEICSPEDQQDDIVKGSGSAKSEEDSSVSLENVDLCPVDAIGLSTKSEQSQLSRGVPETGDDLQVQLNCEVPVTKGIVIDSASTVENKDLEVTEHICEKDSVLDKQVQPENESSAGAGNPGTDELPTQNSGDSQSCPRITNDRKLDETEVKHELASADQVNLRREDEKPKSTLEGEISTEYVNDNSVACVAESKEVKGQSDESQKAQSSKLIDEMLISNLNAMEKQGDLNSDQTKATLQTLEEKDKAMTDVAGPSEPVKQHEGVTKDALKVQVVSEGTAVGHSIDDVKTFSSSATEKKTGENPSSDEKKTERKALAQPEVVEDAPFVSAEEKMIETKMQNTAFEERENVLHKNDMDLDVPSSIVKAVDSEVIQNEPNCENNVFTEVDQNLPNSEVYCTKTTVTTVQVTVPDLGIEETSTDIPQVNADAQDNVFSEVTKEAEYTSLRLEELSCPSEIENRDIAESQKPLVDISDGDLECNNFDSEVLPTLAIASEVSVMSRQVVIEVTSADAQKTSDEKEDHSAQVVLQSDEKENPPVEMVPVKKEDPSVQMVLPSDEKENHLIQMASESDSTEGLSAQQDEATRLRRTEEKDVEIENPGSKSECVTQSDPMEKSLQVKDEAVTARESKNQFMNGSVPLVKTEHATDLKSTPPKSVNTNSDIKTEVKPEELKNVSKRKEKKTSKFNFVKKLKKLVPLSVDSKELKGSSSTRDMFSQINNTLLSISKSKSNVNLHIHELAKSASTIAIKVEEEPEPAVEPIKQEKEEQLETKDMNKNLVPLVKKPVEPQPVMSKESILAKKREEEREKVERMKMSKKLDAVFGVIRKEPPVEVEVKTEIKIRGMGDVTLDRKAPAKKNPLEHNKQDEYELKRAARQQIAMPDKPATYKKPKPKPKPESPKPDPPEPPVSPITIEKIKAKKSCLLFVSKPPSPPKKEKSPDLQEKFWPRQKLPTPEPQPEPEAMARELTPLPPPSPVFNSPLKIGINGFDRMGRLAFRAAFQSGLDVTAVNDPFIPLHYMVYSLKFDMANCPWSNKKSDLKIEEGPSPGQLVVNGKTVQVFTEMDPSNIPWHQAGVNYVIEATESLKKKVDGTEHLKPKDGVVKSPTMKDLVNRKSSDSCVNGDRSSEEPSEVKEDGGEKSEMTNGVRKVVLASNSTDVPSIGIGINEDRLRRDLSVISSISAPANALLIALKVIQDKFGLRFCAYTFIKAIKDVSREIKCPPLGPKTHSRSQKWDFSETLVPAPCPVLEEETYRFLPSMRGRLHGMVVYTPVPEVSMFDLTIGVEKESKELYEEVCSTMEQAAEGKMNGLLKYMVKVEDETR